MTTTPLSAAFPENGGIPVDETALAGSLVTRPGQLQFGPMLLGSQTTAGWRELVGWRDLAPSQIGDSTRPQTHGDFPGSVFADSLVVTYTYLVRGRPDAKLAALNTIESYTPMDGVERMLTVDDGSGPWFRMARVIARSVPQDVNFRHGPVECALQFLCADPRRYALTERSGNGGLSGGVGGLMYALDYPLSYGTPATGAFPVTNTGSLPTPFVAPLAGPLTKPTIVGPGWSLGFDLVLASGETLVVDTAAGTALLNGTADRLYTITPLSDPVDVCLLPKGTSSISLVAETGNGTVRVTYRDARM